MAWFRREKAGAFANTQKETGKRAGENDPTSTLQPWQKQAWGYYEVLGEAHYAGGFLARMLSGITLEVQQRDGKGEWVETTEAKLREPLKDLENSKGGLSELQASYGLLRFVQGEAMLTRTLDGYGKDALGAPILVDGVAFSECWEMLSAAELTYTKSSGRGEYQRRRKPGATADKYPETDPRDPQPDTMTAWRFYHRDPMYSGMADSSMRAVLEDLEELLLLKRAIRNTARNRGAGNGILILPTSLQGDLIDTGDGTKVPKNAQVIYEALTSPIANENASHAVTPILLFAPDTVTSQNAFHIDLRGAALYKETGLRDECIRRIGIGLDMPPEALLGTSGLNHWSAWQIDESAWKSHGAPVAEEFCGQLTSALITPVAIELGLVPDDVRVWYDASEVVQDPDRGRTAMEGHDRLIISDEAARRDLGYAEADAPTPEEWDKRAAIGKPVNSPTTNPAKSEPSKGEASAERVIGLAQACVQRCHAMAGSRLRTQLQRADSPANLRARIKGVPNWDVARTLGGDIRDQCDPDTLVAGAGDEFLGQMVKLGLEPSIAESVVRRTEEHAARTLFDAGDADLPDEVIALCAVTSLRV